MLTGVAILPRVPPHAFPYGWVFIVVVIALILLIFIRVYVFGNRPAQQAEHPARNQPEQPPGQHTEHHAGHPPAQGGNHGHRPASRRRRHRP